MLPCSCSLLRVLVGFAVPGVADWALCWLLNMFTNGARVLTVFMCATEERMLTHVPVVSALITDSVLELALVDSVGIDHVSYLLVLYSVAFLMYLCKCCQSSSIFGLLIYTKGSIICQLQWSSFTHMSRIPGT